MNIHVEGSYNMSDIMGYIKISQQMPLISPRADLWVAGCAGKLWQDHVVGVHGLWEADCRTQLLPSCRHRPTTGGRQLRLGTADPWQITEAAKHIISVLHYWNLCDRYLDMCDRSRKQQNISYLTHNWNQCDRLMKSVWYHWSSVITKNVWHSLKQCGRSLKMCDISWNSVADHYCLTSVEQHQAAT